MTISDIITLVSLIIAILAILTNKNRDHLLLKFHLVDYILFTGAFTLINYFVFYDAFFSKGIYIARLYFIDFGLKNPKNYAYLISLISLSYFFYKIYYAFYPNSRLKSVSHFYRRLIESNESGFLLDLIERYHKKDIVQLVDKSMDDNPDPDWWMRRLQRESFKVKAKKAYARSVAYLFPSSKYNKNGYAMLVMHEVMNDPAFIALASNQRPYLFAEIFASFKKNKRRIFPRELVNSFLSQIIESKNFWLIKELKQSQDFDGGQPEWFFDQNRLLASLLKDLSVSDVNEIWRPFGDAAVNEIEEERTKGYESKMFQEFRDEQFLWEYRTYYAIQFFQILITEAIVAKYKNCHFWLFYYRSITDAILTTFKKFPPKEFEEVETVYHKFIDLMIDNIFGWLHTSNRNNDEEFHLNILDCLGQIIHEICENEFYGEVRKRNVIDRLMDLYCTLEDNSERINVRKEIKAILRKPCMLTDADNSYYSYARVAWERFDRIPHRAGSGLGDDYDYFAEFKKDVIIPLGFNPDLY